MRHVIHALGWLLDLIGIGGMSDDIATWGSWFAWIHDHLDSPLVTFPALITGTLLLSLTYANWITDRRLKKLAASPLERPANFKNWDRVGRFAVWQAAWLFAGLEPRGQPSDGTPAYSMFVMIKQDLSKGLIPGKQKTDGSWSGTPLTRAELTPYAEHYGLRPKFLYTEERHWWTRLRALLARTCGR